VRERAATRWVFKQDGQLYGPVDTEFLEARLRSGELGPEALVAPEHGPFAPIGTVEPFVTLAAEMAARRRMEAARKAARRRIVLAFSAVAGVGAIAGLLGLGREDPLARKELRAIPIEALPMEVRVVDAAEEDEEVYRDLPRERATPSLAATTAASPRPMREASAKDAKDLTVETHYDGAVIERVVASHRDRLLPCLRTQAEADPTFRGEIPLSFVVGNDGRVARLWVDRVGYRDGPLHACLLEELRRWNFPSFEGQRPAISLRFRVGG
jgi:hypothetical protein